jgi:hypothetical protein
VFLKGHYIQDNFRFVQALAKLLHAWRIPYLPFKADISRAFDSVAWPFLLEILGHIGFSNGWLNWISALLLMASTKILMNGLSGEKICCARGLRRGDPLSPMLFLLVMEVLSCLIRKADGWSLLEQLRVQAIHHRASFYAGDVILFVCLRSSDLQFLRNFFDIFHGALGLECNMSKCHLAPIRCSSE